MANQNPVPDYPDGKLFEALRIARVPDRLAFAADKEVGEMAGRNVIAEIRAMKTELNHIRWAMVLLVALIAAFGLFRG
ncbi:MAG: hypothetical protein OXI73_15820 [Rhodospirillales bacterium]|nr:hypothetical protein [Rhodospirillales bacterium]